LNAPLDLTAALARVPGIDAESADVEELQGGLTNRVYRVRNAGRQCVLRLRSDCNAAIGPDRACELAILQSAGAAGIAPEVLYADFDAGILVTEYLHGPVWQGSDLESDENIESLAALLRRVHSLPPCGTQIDLVGMAEQYAQFLNQRQGPHAFAGNCVRIISESPVHECVACCHNDIVASNVIDSGSLKLIDWEYACDNDPMFDLASAIGYHNLDEGRRQIFLDAYAGGAGSELKERLAEQIRVFDAIQWLWLATRHIVAPQPGQARRLEELQSRIRG
jgi:thiamine kinase